ncbi:MAG: hypothetical protein QNK61_00585 [Akkermansiaceae bacterium]
MRAKAAIAKLSSAIDLYFDKYESLPSTSTKDKDIEYQSKGELMAALCGLEAGSTLNPYQLSFFEFKRNKGSDGDFYGGLHRTQSKAALYGPWKNKDIEDRYYRIILDLDGDQSIREPAELGGKLIPNVRYLIYHKGKDGKIGRKFYKDNVYSWK